MRCNILPNWPPVHARCCLAATRSAWPCRKGWRCSPSRSSSKVSSAPMLFASLSGSTGRGSMPRASARSHGPRLPSSRSSQASSALATSPMVRRPRPRTTFSVFGPTPHSRETGKGARNSGTPPSGTTTRPSGLRKSLATFAANFTSAIPTEAVSPRRSRMRALIFAACSTAGRKRAIERVTSRNASSRERPSTSGVNSWKMAKTCSLASA